MTKRLFILTSLILLLLPFFTFAQTAQICSVARTLSRGMFSPDVTTLQLFLKDQGAFSANATGYFGPITEASLANWQLKVGIIAIVTDGGVYGPRSRAYVRDHFCGATMTTNQCPTPPSQPSLQCTGYWNKTYNATQCHVGWTCVASAALTATNKAPLITAITGPTQLKTNESGTWRVTAIDPENDTLSFSIIWGDEGAITAQLLELARMGTGATTNTSFTHTYTASGYYTIVIFAKDTADNDTKATFSVMVEAPPAPPLPPIPPVTNTNNTNSNSGTQTASALCSVQMQDGTTKTFANGTKGTICSLWVAPQNQCLIGALALPQWECRNGTWYACDVLGNNCVPSGSGQGCWQGSGPISYWNPFGGCTTNYQF